MIRFDSTTLGGADDNIGMDNIQFRQVATGSAVPEPATMLLLGWGLLGLAALRRRIIG